MTHDTEDPKRLVELNAAFRLLDDKGKDSALAILRALRFAQSAMTAPVRTPPESVPSQPTAKSE